MAYNWQTETLISRLAPLPHEVGNSNKKIVVVVTKKTNHRKRSHATATTIITIFHYIPIFLVLFDVCLSTGESRM